MSTASVPNTFSAGASIVASQHNANFSALIATINGGLDQANFDTLSGVVTWSITSNVKAISISSNSTDSAVDLTLTGILASAKSGFKLFTSAAQTTGDALVYLGQTHASSTIPAIRYDDTNGAAFQVDADGALKFAGAYTPGWFSNVGLSEATTSAANDSIKIQGATAALSSTNPQFVTLPDEDSPGLLKILKNSSDVTIDLTGAHWGLGTNGDFSDVELRVYAINENGTLKYGISLKGGLTQISDSDSSQTGTSVTAKGKMLVNSTLSSGSWPCSQVGWFKANFDDTGGASEDLWAVQTDLGDINVGIPIKDRTDWESFTPDVSTYFGTKNGRKRRVGNELEVELIVALTSASGGASEITVPEYIDTSSLPASATSGTSTANLGSAKAFESGGVIHGGFVSLGSTTTVKILDEGSNAFWTDAVPFSWGSGDGLAVSFSVPILKWSSN